MFSFADMEKDMENRDLCEVDKQLGVSKEARGTILEITNRKTSTECALEKLDNMQRDLVAGFNNINKHLTLLIVLHLIILVMTIAKLLT